MVAADGWRVLEAFNETLSLSCCMRTRRGMHFVIKTFRVCWGRYEVERGCLYNPSSPPHIYQQCDSTVAPNTLLDVGELFFKSGSFRLLYLFQNLCSYFYLFLQAVNLTFKAQLELHVPPASTFNIGNFSFYIHGFHMILTVNSDYFLKQR
jgi:hypothetical protein